ncbi:ABC transporter permease [Nonlabens agnitus]|uniref:Multidrug ABC transporter ATP-binding protein n=1 Tax=Nonlabens agnitus TaxID=870484 RepID=A0A2S9WVW8_9FLAO|nr:ABC transporter permease [Nonlabens agnitus]PRP67591.1 multidrug ABC transporter ATP-binding protein [Nonlabens agnitus]
MFSKDRWNEILEALNANRFRTFLTAFGVFWGILILVLLLAMTNGLKTGVSKDFGDFATNSMFMWAQRTSMPYKGFEKGRRFDLKIGDVDVLKRKFPELKYVSPRFRLGGYRGANNVTRNEKTGAFEISGDYPEFINQQPMDIIKGRFISYSDIDNNLKSAVIGVDVVKTLYDVGVDPIDTYISINGVNFKVVGVFQNPNSSGDSEEEANTIYLPFTTFAKSFNSGDNVGFMAITAYDDYNITELKPQILATIKEQRSVHPNDERALGNYDIAEQFAKVNGLFNILSFVGFFVGGLILISGGIGISNIMLIVVKERTNEIGVRRALGATPWDIKAQILQESVVLTLAAGFAGIAFSAGVIWIMNFVLDQNGPVENFANPTVNINVIFIALTILVIAGLLAGFIPASRATQMKPVDALRTE